MSQVLEALQKILEQRKDEDADASYVASLYNRGLDKILEKVGEEATEAILAAKNAEATGELDQLVAETADLWFHSMVMLCHLGADQQMVMDELEKRFGMSGHEEKASRK